MGPDVVLMHLAPAPGSGAANGCAGVIEVTFLDVISCLKSVVHLPDHVQGLIDTQVNSQWSTMEFGQHVLHFTPREGSLG